VADEPPAAPDTAPAPPGPGEGAQEPAASPDHSATGGAISTETLADLYAKQGLSDKAAEIYRQILVERPEDQDVLLKLKALEDTAMPGEPPKVAQDDSPGPEPETEAAEDPIDILQLWLDNAERMKQP
jgi:hypothetical protein